MNHDHVIDGLERNCGIFGSLIRNASDAQTSWKSAADVWSILEVLCHLHDEEWEDFRPRVEAALRRGGPAPAFLGDPEERAAERKYQEQDAGEVLAKLLGERRESVGWLRALQLPDWKSRLTIPGALDLSAENLLATWLAHDNLHIRQMLRIEWNYLARHIEPDTLDYAGSL